MRREQPKGHLDPLLLRVLLDEDGKVSYGFDELDERARSSLVGITPQRPRFDTVRAAVRLAFRAHICGLVPASDVNWLVPTAWLAPASTRGWLAAT
jgi:hypothetical protein